MKKILSIILTLVMALGITVPAMAEGIELLEVGESEPTYVKIEIDPYGTEEVITNNNADNPETVMAYRFNGSGFNIYGKYDGKWKLTSFADYGFSTMIGIVSTDENGEEVITSSPVSFDREGKASIHNLVITLAPVFTDNGKTIDFRYTVENKGSEAVTYYLASHADVQIGSDDTANITLFDDKGGFKMVSDEDEDKDALGNGAQFNFFKEDTTGFWFGRFSVRYENVYKNYTVEEYIGDSGCAWHWKDTVAASSSNTHNVKIGIGGKGSEFLNSSMDYVDTEYGSAVLEQSTDEQLPGAH